MRDSVHVVNSKALLVETIGPAVRLQIHYFGVSMGALPLTPDEADRVACMIAQAAQEARQAAAANQAAS